MTMTEEAHSLTVASDVANLESIAAFIIKAAQKANLDEKDIFAIQVAVDEACTNVIEYAYGDAPGDIHLTCQAKPGECVVTIRNHGRPFEPQNVPPPNLSCDLEERTVGGLGLYFMRELMDEVHFSFDPEEGNQVVMIKKANRGNQAEVDRTFSVVTARGRIDAAAAPDLESQLEAVLAQGNTHIVVDMADVSYISSSGLKVLLATLRQARRQGGQLVLCNLQPKVTSIIEVIGFDQVFLIAQDLAAATRLLQQM
jgi:serine/threonine-protein kinase RsbW